MQPLRRHMHLSLMPWVVQTPALSFSSCLLLQSSQMMSLVEMIDQSLVGQSRKGRNKGLRYGKGFLASQLVESWFRSGVLASVRGIAWSILQAGTCLHSCWTFENKSRRCTRLMLTVSPLFWHFSQLYILLVRLCQYIAPLCDYWNISSSRFVERFVIRHGWKQMWWVEAWPCGCFRSLIGCRDITSRVKRMMAVLPLSSGGFWACKFVSTRGNASILWASWLVLAFPSKPVHCF